MTPATFRRLALEQLDAVEGNHMGHADFRVDGKIFASLSPDEDYGVVKLTPEQQEEWTGTLPDSFVALNGAWGRAGWTRVVLEQARAPEVRKALTGARTSLEAFKPARARAGNRRKQ